MRYHELVRRVQEEGGFASPDEAVTAIRATLSALGECLYRTERRHLASQLPQEAKDLLHEYVDSEVRRPPARCLTLQEFYDRVGARANVTRTRAMEKARAVAGVLEDVLPAGEWRHIVEEMPKEYRELLGQETSGPTEPERL